MGGYNGTYLKRKEENKKTKNSKLFKLIVKITL
jgi:hypothetical protein